MDRTCYTFEELAVNATMVRLIGALIASACGSHVVLAQADCMQPFFSGPVAYRAGHDPISLASADLDGDGDFDLAVANRIGEDSIHPGSVSVLLGNGDGTFAGQVSYEAGDGPTAVAIGDFNGDAVPDLAVANVDSDDVSVLLGNGDGTFAAHTTHGTGQGPAAVAIADLNGDDDADLAVANFASDEVSVHLGNGDGTFADGVLYAVGENAQSIVIADFNADLAPDLAVSNSPSDNLSVLLGMGDGTFMGQVTYPAGDFPRRLAAADLNTDGAVDLAVSTADGIALFLGIGDGSFGAAAFYGKELPLADLAIADLNSDGTYDLVVDTVAVLLGYGDGTFAAPVSPLASTAFAGLAVADFDADTHPDLAMAHFAGETVSIMLSTLPCGNCVIDSDEDCDGGACCAADCTFVASGLLCRESQGGCDVAESCTGDSSDCPPDEFEDSTTVCNPGTAPCELDIYCDGLGPLCPSLAGHICDDDNACTVDVCTESEECTHTDIDGLPCDSDEDCDGPFIGPANCEAGFCACPGTGPRSFMIRAGDDPDAAPLAGPTTVQMLAGSTIDIAVFFEDPLDVDDLNAYQLIFPWFAMDGDSGTVSYVDVNPGMPAGNTVFIDKAHPDWVFKNNPASAVLPIFTNETPVNIFGVIYNYLPAATVPVCGPGCIVPHCCGPNYVAQFSLMASADASGTFQLPFNAPGSGGSPPFCAYFNPISAAYGAYSSNSVTFQPLEITIVPCLTSHDHCADADADGLRDASCAWWECEAATCVSTAIPFADIGGANGACPPDLTVDANDRFHALNCFSDIDTMGNALSYPCEDSPPGATNVDAGGAFGACCPDGVCDGNDAFHTLHAFVGDSPCHCPANFVCPCPVPTAGNCIGNKLQSCTSDDDCGGNHCNLVLCPPGPQPNAPAGVDGGPRIVGRSAVRLAPSRSTVAPGDLVEVDVFLEDALADLRGYQLHVEASGGMSGSLELVDVAVHERRDQVFAGLADWRAFNARTGQMLAGMDSEGVATRPSAYLATFTYQASADAAGTFSIELLHDDRDPAQRTFIFPTPPGAKIQIESTDAAVVTIDSAPRGRLTPSRSTGTPRR
jgi:hypothetical protein